MLPEPRSARETVFAVIPTFCAMVLIVGGRVSSKVMAHTRCGRTRALPASWRLLDQPTSSSPYERGCAGSDDSSRSALHGSTHESAHQVPAESEQEHQDR